MTAQVDEFDMDQKMKELAEKENISFLKTLLKFKNKGVTTIKPRTPKEASKYLTVKEKTIEPTQTKPSALKEENKTHSNVVFISDLNNQLNSELSNNKEQHKESNNVNDNSISSIQLLEQELTKNKKQNENKNSNRSISKKSTFYNTNKSIREIEQLINTTKQIENKIPLKSYSTQKRFNITYHNQMNTPSLTKNYVTKSKYQSTFTAGGQKELYSSKGKNKKIIIRNQKLPMNSYYKEAKKNQHIVLTEQSKGDKSYSLRSNKAKKSKSVPKFINKVKQSNQMNSNVTVKKYAILKKKDNQYYIVKKK